MCVNLKLLHTSIYYQISWSQHCCPPANLPVPVRVVEPGLPKGKQRRNKHKEKPDQLEPAISAVRGKEMAGLR